MAILKDVTIGDCRLILGDCLEVMPTLGKVDAVVADPPYGISYKHGPECSPYASAFNGKMILGDTEPFDPAPFLEFPCLLWGANHFASRLPAGGRWLVWDKRAHIKPNDQSCVEIAWLSGPRRADRKITHIWNGYTRDSERNVPRVHQTQKPIAVMEWCLGFLPDARTILDPFMGSGTTLVACAKLGRKGIGIELDPGYFEIACKRVRDAYAQPDLFIAPPEKPVQEVLL